MKSFFAIIFIIVLGAFLYALTLRGVIGNPNIETVKSNYEGSTNPLELSPERGRFAHVMSLALLNKYELGNKLGMLSYPDVGYKDGRFYSYFAPGIAYMTAPLYKLGERYQLAQVFTFAFVSVMSILAMIFIYKVTHEIIGLPIGTSLLAPIIFAFGSTAWSYAITLYQHHLTTFFIISGFYGVWRYAKDKGLSWLWGFFIWMNYGLAITIDYPNAVLMMPVMIYFLYVSVSTEKFTDGIKISLRPAFILTSILFIVVSGAHMYHNDVHFGGWSKLSGGLPSYKRIVEADVQPNTQHESPEKEKNVIGFFSEVRLVRSFTTLMFSTDRGLFFYGPIFLLGFWGLFHYLRFRMNLESLTLTGIIAANIFLYSSWGDPWGGWAYGTRYLIPSMGVLSIFIAWWVNHFSHWYWRMLIILLFAYSSAVGLLGALTTNAVPPSVEAIGLGIPDNYILNLDFIKDNRSGSFIYRTYLHEYISLIEYFEGIYALVMLVFLGMIISINKKINAT